MRAATRRPECRVLYDERAEPMTGLLHHSGLPWDLPHCWRLEVEATFAGHVALRTDRMEMRVTVGPGAGRLAAQRQARAILTRLGAVSAIIRRMVPPMTPATVYAIKEANAQLEQLRVWRLAALWTLCGSDRRGAHWATWRPFDPPPADAPRRFDYHAVAAARWPAAAPAWKKDLGATERGLWG